MEVDDEDRGGDATYSDNGFFWMSLDHLVRGQVRRLLQRINPAWTRTLG